MSTVSLPGINDYREAMQNPHLFLGDPELKRCKPAWDPKQHQPKIWSGNFAAVFQLQSPDGSKFAIKCFYRDIRNLETRYAEFDNHLSSRRPGYLVRFQYQPQGILVNGQWFPIVRMEWVEGQRLDEFLQHHLQRPGPQTRELLEAMAQLWHGLAGQLERDRLAHGDLQHGNVLFIPGNRPNSVKLRLVDYDGVWVPALDTLPSNESGQPNYQHPQRRYGPLMDRFPHLVIYTTLRCLMLDQQLARHFSDQRLVFGQEDYAQPGRSELFRELWKNCREPNTRNLVGHLILACVQPFEQTPSLQELVPDGATGWVRPLTTLQQARVEEVLRNGSLSPQSSATSVSFASTGLGDRSVPNATPPTGSTSARPQLRASPGLAPIPVPTTPRPGVARDRSVGAVTPTPVPTTPRPPDETDYDFELIDEEAIIAELLAEALSKSVQRSSAQPNLHSKATQVQPSTPQPFHALFRVLGPVLAGTAVGCLVGAILGPLYAALVVLTPFFVLLALCLARINEKQTIPVVVVMAVGAASATLAPLILPVLTEWWWPVNCWWFGALVGLAVGTGAAIWSYAVPARAGPIQDWRPLLFRSLLFASACSAVAVLALGWIPNQFALRPPAFAASWYEARRPTLTVTQQQPEKGPIAGEPFTIEFEATSPAGRAVHVEWRYAGDTQWQRLPLPKLQIPEVKGDALALEFRAVDSKGFLGSVVEERCRPAASLKITKQDPPNGPIAGEPFTIEFEATSPVGRAVHVEWRYAGQAQWQRLAEPKLLIPQVKGDSLALEFRAVDSKGYSSDVLARHWDVSFMVRQLTGHEGSVWSVAVTPDGKYVVSGSHDNTVRLWELATGQEVRRFTGHEWGVGSVAVTPDGKYVVSGGGDKTLRLWELATGQEVRRFTGHEGSVSSVAVTPDGKYVVSGSRDKTVRLWDLATWKEGGPLTGHDDSVWSLTLTPDGRYVVSGSGDRTVRLWELATGQAVRRLTGHEGPVNSVAVTPDGKYVVSGSGDYTVRLWELATGQEVRRFTGHENSVLSVAVTPDGKYVVSGSSDKTVRVWEPARGKEVRRFTGHEWVVSSVAVTPDGRYVVSGSNDKTVRVWYIGDLK